MISYPLGVGQCTIRVIEAGAGDNAIVLLHGSGSRADRWRRNVPGLAEAGYHVYALDFPGHGFATKPPDADYSARGFAAVVSDALGALQIVRPVLVGTSLGGHVAAYLAIRARLSVRALALVGSVGITPVQRDIGSTVGRIKDVSDAGVEGKLKFLVYDQSLVTPEWVREERWFNTSPGAQFALEKTARSVAADIDLIGDELAGLGIPVILMWGEQDKWVPPAIGHWIRSEVLDQVPLVLLARAGHAPYFERPDAFNGVLVKFLKDPTEFGSKVITI